MANVNVISDYTAAQLNEEVSRMFVAALAKRPVMRWVRFGSPVGGGEGAKFGWPEEARTETTDALAATHTAASTVTVADGTKFTVGDQFQIEGGYDSNNVFITFRVDSIAGNVLTVTAVNGTDTTITLASPAQTIYINKSSADNSVGGYTDGTAEPTIVYSYLQLIEESFALGRKAIRAADSGLVQGIDDMIARGMEQKMDQLSWKTYRMMMDSVGVAEAGATTPAKTKGFKQFINTSSDDNRVDAGAGTITEADINDLVEKLYLRGMPEGEPKVLVLPPKQARAVSALRHAKVQYPSDVPTFGGAIQSYITELSGIGPVEIVADPNMDSKLGILISPNWAEMVPANDRSSLVEVEETTTSVAKYGRQWRMTSELGLKCMYATRFHGAIYNLA